MRAKDDVLEGGGGRRSLRSRLLRRRKGEQGARVVCFPHHAAPHTLLHPHGGQLKYRGNRTSTTKYTLLTFLPKSLFEQYRCGAGVGEPPAAQPSC
jgi:hypothetical protein